MGIVFELLGTPDSCGPTLLKAPATRLTVGPAPCIMVIPWCTLCTILSHNFSRSGGGMTIYPPHSRRPCSTVS